jgi:hypothetical protein
MNGPRKEIEFEGTKKESSRVRDNKEQGIKIKRRKGTKKEESH